MRASPLQGASRGWLIGLAAALVVAATAAGANSTEATTPLATQAGSTATSLPLSASARASTVASARRFPLLKVSFSTDLDSLDPAVGYSLASWDVGWYIYLPLLTYRHAGGPAGTKLIPALAQSLPVISADGKDYRFRLRPGLEYSDGTPLKASDIAYAIKRLFLMDSPGVGYYTGIVGANEFAKTKKGDIKGIVTNDAARTVEFKLAQPRGDFLNILAMQFAAPVPTGTATEDRQAKKPIPASGPYQIENYQPNQTLVLVRNDSYKLIPGIPTGNADRIELPILANDGIALQKTINGETDVDYRNAPADRLGELQTKYASQLKVEPQAYTSYFFMNTQVSPFDKLAVRQAVNYAIDRQAIVRLYGGLATPTQQVLPPGYPSYKKLNLYPHDETKAKRLISSAGATGATVKVWSPVDAPYKQVAEYLADTLNKVGLKAGVKTIDFSVYFTTVGDQKTKPQIGIGLWAADYPNPINWFDATLNGASIRDKGNTNLSRANVGPVNRLIERLKLQPKLTAGVNAKWADVDELVMKNALWAPFVNPVKTFFLGKGVNPACYTYNVLYLIDMGLLCKKG
jgi:peptide/nickel transport system substrate-binding protein